MLVELTFLLLIAVVGRLALSRLPGHGVDPSGAIVGSALYVAAVIVLLGVGLPAQPLTAMLVSLAAGLLLAFGADPRMWRSRVSGLRPERRTAIATTLVLSTGALLHPLRLVRDATDASAHLAYAARLQDGPFAIAEVGIKRGVSFAAIEAVGVLGGDVAVMGVVPALGVAGLLSAYAIVRAEDPTGDAGRILGLVALAIVATNARFLTNLMLIGSHLVVALWLMVLVAVLAGVGDSGGVRADRPRLAIVSARSPWRSRRPGQKASCSSCRLSHRSSCASPSFRRVRARSRRSPSGCCSGWSRTTPIGSVRCPTDRARRRSCWASGC